MNVTLYRDMPTEGWPSMERYADGLTAGLSTLACSVTAYTTSHPFRRLGGRAGALMNHAWRTLAYPRMAKRCQGDINHVVDHSYSHLLNSLDPNRTVVTCHDVAPLALDERGRGLSRRLWDRAFAALPRAARIIVDSHFTRSELLRYMPYPIEHVSVVWPGVSDHFFQSVPEWQIEAQHKRLAAHHSRIVLHVGSCVPRKNVGIIVEALALQDAEELHFVQVGGRFTEAQQARIHECGLARRVHQFAPVSDDELRAWYHAADVLVFPSLYEGFGFPLIEAMASGAVVVCNDLDLFREVADDAALFADATDPHNMATALACALNQAEVADVLRHRGLARARQFTWQHCAEQTLAVYRGLAEEIV